MVGTSSSLGRPADSKKNEQKKAGAERVDTKPLDYIPGQVLVKFRGGTSTDRKKQIKKSNSLGKTLKKINLAGNNDIYLVQTRSNRSAKSISKTLQKIDDVLFANPNYIRRTTSIPNDPYFNNQWHLRNYGQTIESQVGIPGADIDATNAWDVTTGAPVPVAVIDSGIDLTHPDLASKLWENTGEIPGNEIDDDSNGYVDDINGYDTAGISQFSGNAGWSLGKNSTYERAQSIKGKGHKLTHIGLLLTKIGSPSANIEISIRSSLGGPDLTGVTITPGDVSTSWNEVYKELTSPIILVDGQTYYIVFRATSSHAAKYYGVYDNASGSSYYNTYAFEDGWEQWWNGSSWDQFLNDDFYFRTNGDNKPSDGTGHGTHVSGIIGAQANNGLGVSGVSFGAEIMAVRAGDDGGALATDAILEAIYYAANNGARVINMSYGGGSPSSIEQDALNYAHGQGVALFASAGNDYDTTLNYPAAYDNVIGVGATTNRDQRASFSNYNARVDLSAPGQYIYSTMPTYDVKMNLLGYAKNYDFMSGTSMASPVAAGAAALLRSFKPSMDASETQQVMEANSDDLGAAGRDDSFGHGRVNLYQALLAITPPVTTMTISPSAPNGDDGWYTTNTTITLLPDETATTYFNWDGSPDVTYTAPFSAPEGEHDLSFFSIDTAGNTETVKNQTLKVDTTDPTDPTLTSLSHTISITSTTSAVTVDLSGATDTPSGVEGFSITWSEDTSETPPQTMNTSASVSSTTSAPLSDGNWWVNVRTKDYAGRWTSTAHMGPFIIDTAAPSTPPKLALIRENLINVQSLSIYPTPTTIGGNLGLAVATDYWIGNTGANSNITHMVSADFDGDLAPELAIIREKVIGVQSLSIYETPTTIGGNLGAAIASDYWIGNTGANSNITHMAAADFDGDTTPELAIIRENTSGLQSFYVFETPTTVGGDLGVAIATDWWVGNTGANSNVTHMVVTE